MEGKNGRYVQHAVHLGAGHVLAKVVSGFNGTDFQVEFMRSTDSGGTWATFSPIGFTASLLNQHFGEFTVHRARSQDEPGVVLLNAWDFERSAYFVWESKDDGSTWTRRGQLAKPDQFRRVDAMLDGDGGGNFSRLAPGTDMTRDVDVTIPDRYTGA